MADIAILVAEEFERRMTRDEREWFQNQRSIFFPQALSALGRSLRDEISSLKVKVGFAGWALEPRSPFSLAASHGCFSA